MNDFDFDELDRAVSNTLGGNKNSKPPASSSDSSQSEQKKDDSSTAPAAPAPAQQPANESLQASESKDSKSDKKPGEPAKNSLIKPRTSINRTPQSTAASRGGAVDIVAPSKKSPHSGATVSPIRPGIELEASGAKADTKKDAPTTDSAQKSHVDPETPSGVSAPEKTVAENNAASLEASVDSAAAKIENKGDEGSFDRFESLSRSGFDFDKEEKPADESKTPELQTVSEHELAASKETDVAPAKDISAGSLETEKDAKESSEEPNKLISETEAPEEDDEKDDKKEDAEAKYVPVATSPFLSDTKVEKRPLGSYGGQSATLETKDAERASETGAETKKPAEKEETKPSIEVKTATDKDESHETKSTSAAGGKLDTDFETKDTNAATLGSIPQQYKTAAAEQKENGSHPVFDTKEYHAPISDHGHAPNTGSNWFLIIAVIILALAVGAAVAIYLYGSELGLALPEVGKPNTSSL